MHQLVDHAELLRLGRALTLAGEDDVERAADTDEPRQAVAAAGTGDEPELHFGKAKLGLGVIGRDAPVTGEGELVATAEAGAMDRGDDRLGRRGDTVHQVLRPPAQQRRLFRGADPGELLDVGAGDEAVFLAGDEDDPAHVGIGPDPGDQGVELGRNRGGQGVHRCPGNIQRDYGDAAFDLEFKCGHCRSFQDAWTPGRQDAKTLDPRP